MYIFVYMIPIPYNLVIYKNHRHHVALDAHVKDRKTVASAGERPRVSCTRRAISGKTTMELHKLAEHYFLVGFLANVMEFQGK